MRPSARLRVTQVPVGLVVRVSCVVRMSFTIGRLMMVKRQESLEQEKSEQAGGGARNRRGRANPHGFRQHVEECCAQHRAGRKTEVDLQPSVVEDRRQGNDPAQHAGDQYGQATRNERDRHVVGLAAHGSGAAARILHRAHGERDAGRSGCEPTGTTLVPRRARMK